MVTHLQTFLTPSRTLSASGWWAQAASTGYEERGRGPTALGSPCFHEIFLPLVSFRFREVIFLWVSVASGLLSAFLGM